MTFSSGEAPAVYPPRWLLPYMSDIGMCPPPPPAPKGRVSAPFWSETGTHFAHFGLESGMLFEGTTGVYERSYRFNSK